MQPKSTKSANIGESTISCVCSDLRWACMSSKPLLGYVAEHILQISKRMSFANILVFSIAALFTSLFAAMFELV